MNLEDKVNLYDQAKERVKNILILGEPEDEKQFDNRYETAYIAYHNYFSERKREHHSDDFTADWIAHRMHKVWDYPTIFMNKYSL